MTQPMQGAGAQVRKVGNQLHYPDSNAKYAFSCEVIDNRTGERMDIIVEANTKASAGKRCRELGYTVRSMSWC